MVTLKLTHEEINLLEETFSMALEFTGDENEQPDQDCIDTLNEKLTSANLRANKTS